MILCFLYINSVKSPSDKFNILLTVIDYMYVEFTSGTTRSAGLKLKHKSMNSYFYRIPRLWNSIPVINPSHPLTIIKSKLKIIFGIILLTTSTATIFVLSTIFVLAISV